MWIFQLLMLKNVSPGPLSPKRYKRLATFPASLSPLGGSADKTETNKRMLVITQVNDFLMFIKVSTILSRFISHPRRRPEYLF